MQGQLVAQVQVHGVELAGLGEAVPVADRQPARVQPRQAAIAQLLHHPVDVDQRQAEGVAQHPLGQGKIAGAVAEQADVLHPRGDLAEKVGRAGIGAAPPHADDPFAEDRPLHRGVPVQERSKPLVGVGEAMESADRGHCDPRLRDRRHRMV